MQIRTLIAAAGVLVAWLTAADLSAGTLSVRPVGQWGGWSKAVAISGNRAYLSCGPRLIVLDVSQPAQPVFLGQSEPLGDVIEAVVVSGHHAYVAAYDAGIVTIDVLNPAAPVATSRANINAHCQSVFVTGDRLYSAQMNNGMTVFSLANPAVPLPIAAASRTAT